MIQDESTQNSATIDQVLTEVSLLRDLFQRRLVEDKIKSLALDQLSQANERLNRILEDMHFSSIMKELLLVCDRIDSCENASSFVLSIKDELLEIAERRGIHAIPFEGKFNPMIHNAVEAVPVSDDYPSNSIVTVVRNGYYLDDKVFRPVDVVVASERLV